MSSGASSASPPLPPAQQEKLDTLQRHNAELRALVAKHSTFEAQHTENSMVRAELDNLRPDEPVFKLYGKMLVKQDPSEARATVSQRIKMIETELCVRGGAAFVSLLRRGNSLNPAPRPQIKIRQANSRGAVGASSRATSAEGLRGRSIATGAETAD
jgi:chaperonin cofactor prefoldin